MQSTTMKMHVLKRNGTVEDVSFDKIMQRIHRLCWPEGARPTLKGSRPQSGLSVDVSRIVGSICASIVDGITTAKLDDLTADKAASLMVS